MNKLVKIISKKGTVKVINKVHVGIGQAFGIGGIDNAIVRNIYTGDPYIPGSSLKGRMRSGLEVALGRIDGDGGACACGRADCIVCKLFGTRSNAGKCGPGRLVIYDIELSDEFKKKEEVITTLTHNSINRTTGRAKDGAFMSFEAIESGTILNYRIDIKVFEGDNEKELCDTVDKCLSYVELSGIGGKVSSGYGKVKFEQTSEEVTTV